MLALSRGEALGEGVGDLLELQRAFHGDRIAHMAAEEQERLRVHHLLGGLLHGLGLGVEDPLDLAGHVLQGVDVDLGLVVAVVLELLGLDAHLSSNFLDGEHLGRLGDFNVGHGNYLLIFLSI